MSEADRCLSYKFRLLPTKRQHRALEQHLEEQRLLYNAALEERIGCYRLTGKSRTYIDQCKGLTEWRQSDDTAAATPMRIQRWTLKRLDEAYASFFRRLKLNRGKAGYPRFRGKNRWDSFGFSEFIGIRIDGKRLSWTRLPGSLRVHMHRALPAGYDIRSCVFRRDTKGWAICLQLKAPMVEPRAVLSAVGVDLGLKVFAYQSDGAVIPSPQIARRAEKAMRRRQRAFARCKQGSERRRKVRAQLCRLHAKISNSRSTWLHQQSARIVKNYDLIVAEDLNIQGMVRNHTLARSISDASWGTFLSMISYKAAKAGGQFVTVNPKNTSQRCSGCDELVPKALAVRTHSCPHCGLVIDRDWNAALNILQAVVSLGAGNEARWGERRLGNIIHGSNSVVSTHRS